MRRSLLLTILVACAAGCSDSGRPREAVSSNGDLSTYEGQPSRTPSGHMRDRRAAARLEDQAWRRELEARGYTGELLERKLMDRKLERLDRSVDSAY